MDKHVLTKNEIKFILEGYPLERKVDINGDIFVVTKNDGTELSLVPIGPEPWYRLKFDEKGNALYSFPEKEKTEITPDFLIIDLNLSPRVKNRLKEAGIENLGQLILYTPEKLKLLRGIRNMAIKEIQRFLKNIGYELAKD